MSTKTVTVEIVPEHLATALNAVQPFVCQDPTRFHLNGVALAVEGGLLTLVATNGHTLGRAKALDAKVESEDCVLAILPDADAKHLAKLSKEGKKSTIPVATLEIAGLSVTYKHGTTTFTARATDSKFPPYAAVIPPERSSGKGSANLVGLNPTYLADVSKAAKLYCGKGSRGIRVSWPAGELDPVRFDASDPLAGDFTAVIMPMRI